MKYQYRTQGTCSQMITLDVEDNIVKSVEFFGGCHGRSEDVV